VGFKGNLAAALATVMAERDRRDDYQAITEKEAGEILAAAFLIAGTDLCFVKAGPAEPIFVLRAQDKLAPGNVREWAIRRSERMPPAETKVTEAMILADEMEAWGAAHRTKLPD
jgi:hypothetical protein